MDTKITMHLGMHKTGTTMLQKALSDVQQRLDQGSIILSQPNDPRLGWRDLRSELLRLGPKYSPAKTLRVRALLQALIEEAAATGIRHIVISDENLCGPPPMPSRRANKRAFLYPFLLEQIRTFREAIPFADLDIVFSVREQDSFIESLYLDGLKHLRYDLDINEYLNLLDLDSFFIGRRIDEIKAAVDCGIFILHHEKLKHRPLDFVAEFLEHCGISVELGDPPKQPVNARHNADSLFLCRALCSLIEFDNTDESIKKREIFKRWFALMPQLNLADRDQSIALKINFDTDTRSQIREYFREDLTYRNTNRTDGGTSSDQGAVK